MKYETKVSIFGWVLTATLLIGVISAVYGIGCIFAAATLFEVTRGFAITIVSVFGTIISAFLILFLGGLWL